MPALTVDVRLIEHIVKCHRENKCKDGCLSKNDIDQLSHLIEVEKNRQQKKIANLRNYKIKKTTNT